MQPASSSSAAALCARGSSPSPRAGPLALAVGVLAGFAIAKVLDVTAEYLLGDKDASMPTTKKESAPEDVAFFRRYMGMKPAEKEKLREMSDVMFKKKDG